MTYVNNCNNCSYTECEGDERGFCFNHSELDKKYAEQAGFSLESE